MKRLNQILPRICSCICIAASLACSDTSLSQDKPQTVDEVRDLKRSIALIQSLDQFQEHASALMEDLGYGVYSDSARGLFAFKNKGEFDTKRPIIFYSDDFLSIDVTQLPIKSVFAVKKLAGPDVEDFSGIFKARDVGFRPSFYYGPEKNGALIQESRFAFAQERKSLEEYQKAPPLKNSLNTRFQKLFNESGMTVFTRVDDDFHPRLGSLPAEQFTPEEKETLEQIDKVFESAKHTAVGFTYDKKCIALRGLVGFKDHKAAEVIFNFKAAANEFSPTIGLPLKNVISTASFQLDALRSPESTRLIPKLLTGDDWLMGKTKWLEGQSIGIATQLLADTWHDVSGVRAGLYQSAGGDQGQMCLIGVVDPRDPDSLIDELRKLVILVDKNTDPQAIQNRATEIAALIEQLNSKEYNVRQRATTRLMLAGNEAREPIIAATQSENAEVRARANQILKKLKSQLDRDLKDLSVNSTEFWANLQPQFSMENEKVKYGNHETHVLRIHPDPAKGEAAVREATEVMVGIFGKSWNQVPMMRVGDRYVFMFGTNFELFDESVANLKANRDPIGSSDLIAKQNVVPGQFQVQVCLPRYFNLYYSEELKEPFQPGDNNLTTLTVTLDRETWGANLHMPIEEAKTLLDFQMRRFRRNDQF